MTYKAWIADYLKSVGKKPVGMCGAACAAMVLDFPELVPVSGFVDIGADWLKPHWWCVDPVGKIIDPTASQFEQILEYITL